MPHSAIDVANYFVRRAIHDGRPLTPMQVLKLTFLAHGWTLAWTSAPLINEPVQAWKYGPVIPSVYYAFNKYGAAHIFQPTQPVDALPQEVKNRIEKIYVFYSPYTGSQLSALTHKKGSSWDKIAGKFTDYFPMSLEIPDSLIEEYYKELAAGPLSNG